MSSDGDSRLLDQAAYILMGCVAVNLAFGAWWALGGGSIDEERARAAAKETRARLAANLTSATWDHTEVAALPPESTRPGTTRSAANLPVARLKDRKTTPPAMARPAAPPPTMVEQAPQDEEEEYENDAREEEEEARRSRPPPPIRQAPVVPPSEDGQRVFGLGGAEN